MALKFPTIFVLPTRLTTNELDELEEQIPSLTYDVNEAEVVLGKISKKERALFELRRLGLVTEEVAVPDSGTPPRAKRRRVSSPAEDDSKGSDSSLTDDDDGDDSKEVSSHQKTGKAANQADPSSLPTVKVLKVDWFTDSVKKGKVLPIPSYLIYEGRKIDAKPSEAPKKAPPNAEKILERALADGPSPLIQYANRSTRSTWRRSGELHGGLTKRPSLVKQTTSEHDTDAGLPPIPAYLHTTYSCQRPTPPHPPNEAFVEELKMIRTVRTLAGDRIGIRAYSTSIAAVAAYPYLLQSAQEVARLPGCGAKIAELWQAFKETGKVPAGERGDTDAKMAVLKLFYEIWGVADATARDFYNRGWRDLDDVVEYGWDTLSRVQQIGVKYYDDFQTKIPRAEVEAIANTVLAHANALRAGFEMVIVGGYRRGKAESGDVDMVLSHRDEAATLDFVVALVTALEASGHITHTLTLSTRNSERGQTPVAWKGNVRSKPGVGFDTLDKALVVWQDPYSAPQPSPPTVVVDDAAAAAAAAATDDKNPNPHHRVDIIISPWKTAGCAVLGWTSGTTFQRDMRRYCKRERALKFDSSGIRSRADGAWVDFESRGGVPAPDMLTAERRVFAGLELEWRPPEERCTG